MADGETITMLAATVCTLKLTLIASLRYMKFYSRKRILRLETTQPRLGVNVRSIAFVQLSLSRYTGTSYVLLGRPSAGIPPASIRSQPIIYRWSPHAKSRPSKPVRSKEGACIVSSCSSQRACYASFFVVRHNAQRRVMSRDIEI